MLRRLLRVARQRRAGRRARVRRRRVRTTSPPRTLALACALSRRAAACASSTALPKNVGVAGLRRADAAPDERARPREGPVPRRGRVAPARRRARREHRAVPRATRRRRDGGVHRRDRGGGAASRQRPAVRERRDAERRARHRDRRGRRDDARRPPPGWREARVHRGVDVPDRSRRGARRRRDRRRRATRAATPIELAHTTDDIVWIDVVPTPRGAIALWVEQPHGGGANLLAAALGSDGAMRGVPARVARGVTGWQVVPTADGVGLALVTRAGAGRQERERSRLATARRRCPRNRRRRWSSPPGSSIAGDVDAVRVGDQILLAWTDASQPDPQPMLASIDAAAHVHGPKRAIEGGFGGPLVGLAAGPAGAVVAWEEPFRRGRASKRITLARVDPAGAGRGRDDGAPARPPGARRPRRSPGWPTASPSSRRRACAPRTPLATTARGPDVRPPRREARRHAGRAAPPRRAARARERRVGARVRPARKSAASSSPWLRREDRRQRVAAVNLPRAHDRLPRRRSRSRLPAAPLSSSALDTIASGRAVRRPRVRARSATGRSSPCSRRRTTRPRSATTTARSPCTPSTAAARPPRRRASRSARSPSAASRSRRPIARTTAPRWRGSRATRGIRRSTSRASTATASSSTTSSSRTRRGTPATSPSRWAGDKWIVAWVDTRDGNGEVYATTLDRDGRNVGHGQRITNAPGDASDVRSCSPGRRRRAGRAGSRGPIRARARSDGFADIYVAQLRPRDASRAGDEVRVLATAAHSRSPALGARGKDVAVGWIEEAPMGADATRTRAYGAMLAWLGPGGDPASSPVASPWPATASRPRLRSMAQERTARSTRCSRAPPPT